MYGRGIRFISVMDILNNKFITYDVILGSVNLDPTNKSNERFLVRYGDIVFQRSSENVEDAGKSNVYMDKEKPAAFGGFVIRGKKIAVYEPIFMKYVLDGQFVRNQIMSVAQGAQHINVGQEALRNILVNLPKADEQKSIGSFFLEIDNLITLHQREPFLNIQIISPESERITISTSLFSSSWMICKYVFCVVVILECPSLRATLAIETPANNNSEA